MKFSGGYIKDAPHKRTQKDFAEHPAASAAPPASASLVASEFHPGIDQNGVGSCTASATAHGLCVAFTHAGKPLPFVPSPKSIYAIDRTYELPSADAALSDTGAMPADAMRAINEFGIRAMQSPSPQGYNSDCDPSNCNEKESLVELEADQKTLVVGQHRINEASDTFITQVQQAIAAGAPVCLGIFVDTAFEDWDPSQEPLSTVNLADENGGGHFICCDAYETRADGTIVFTLWNTWSDSFGDNGHIYVTDAWMRAAVSDAYPITAALEVQS